MKARINEKEYDEELDKKLWTWSNGLRPGDFYYYEENLQVNRCGDYYLYKEGGLNSPCSAAWGSGYVGAGRMFEALTADEARAWAEEKMPSKERTKIFGRKRAAR